MYAYICVYGLHSPGLLLLTGLMSCKKEILEINGDFFSEQLMKSNTENPGTDCPVNTFITNTDKNICIQIFVKHICKISVCWFLQVCISMSKCQLVLLVCFEELQKTIETGYFHFI